MAGFEFLVVFLLIVLNGLLAMSELAVVSAKPSRLQQRADEGSEGAKVALELYQEPDRFLSTVQIGITMIGVGTGALGGATLAGPVGDALARIPGVGVTTGRTVAGFVVVIAITYLSLIIGELVPKRIALQRAEAMATLMSRPLKLMSTITAPIVSLLALSSDVVLRVIGQHGDSPEPVSAEEVHHLLREGREAGVFEAAETKMVAGVFDVGDRTAGEIMTPRHRVVFLDLREPDEMNRTRMRDESHSHYPVCEASTDHIVGMVAARDLWLQHLRGEPFDLKEAMREPLFVPEIGNVLEIIEQMRSRGARDAMVVDEYGGVVGLLALSDILSDVVGELDGQTNTGIKGAVKRADGTWLLDGNLPAHEARELLDIDEFPGEDDGHFETIAGFLMDQLGRIPTEGDHVDHEGFRLEVADMDGHRIDKLLVTSLDSVAESSAPSQSG